MRPARLLPAVAVLLVAAFPTCARAVQLTWGCVATTYCNPTATAKVGGLLQLDPWGDFMGFNTTRPGGVPPSGWSGIERLAAGGGRYFVAATGHDKDTQFDVIEMGSRRTTLERLGSNRRAPNPQFAPPPAGDRTLYSVFQDPGFNETGSPSSLGDLLAVPIWGPGGKARIALYDMRDPLDPDRFGSVTPTSGIVRQPKTVALAQLKDGSYLMVLGSYLNNRGGLDFYVAPPGPRPAGWVRRGSWKVEDLRTADGFNDKFGYTSIHLVGRGVRLNLLGSVQRGGKDQIDTMQLDGTPQDPQLTKVDRDLFRCRDADAEQCNFDAGASVYVTPSHQALAYGVQKARIGGGSRFARFEEFRESPPILTCDRDTSFLQLYDRGDLEGFSLMVDHFDFPQGIPDLFQQYFFLRRASGARWCLAPGDKARLYEERDPCSGGYVELEGSGHTYFDTNFNDTKGPVQRFDNKASCLRWVYDPSAPAATPTPGSTATAAPTPTATPDLRADLVISAASKTKFTVTNQGRTNAPAFKVLVQSAGTFPITGLAAGASTTKSFSTGTCLDTRNFTADSENTVPESKEDNNVTVYPEHCSQAPGRR